MTHENERMIESDSDPSGRISGFILGVGAVSMAVFMAMHPSGHAHDVAGFVAELESGAGFNGFVHGTLMAVGGVVLLGLLGLCEELGWCRVLVRAGLIAYVTGNLAGVGAAAINGFILPGVVSHRSGDEAAIIDKLKPTLALCMEANGVLARIDVFAMSVAIGLWSVVLLGRSGGTKAIGVAGLVLGGLPLAALLAGRLPMNVHGFGGFVLAQVIWYLTVATQMVRGKL